MAETEEQGGPNSPAPFEPKKGAAAVVETAEGDAKAAVAQVDEKAVKAARIVETWVSEHLRNTPLSRATVAWNHLIEKIPELVSAIRKEL